MKMILTMLPTVLLVVYSQLVMKWRLTMLAATADKASGEFGRLGSYLLDPYVLSSFGAALVGSIVWMFVVERYPISVAFPIYVGLTVGAVVAAGILMFGEAVTLARLAAIVLILAGVFIGSRS